MPPPLSSPSPDLLDEFTTLVALQRCAALRNAHLRQPPERHLLQCRRGGAEAEEEEVADGIGGGGACGEIVEHARGTRQLLHAKVVLLLREFSF